MARFAPKHVAWYQRNRQPHSIYEKDRHFNDLYEEAQIKTQMDATDNPLRRMRHYQLNQIIKNIDPSKGEFCELGCWRGLSAYQIASYLKAKEFNSIFHIFDSFQGLSKIQKVDQPDWNQNDDEVRKIFSCSEETVQNNLKEFHFIRYYNGWIPDRYHEVKDK